MIKEIMTNPVAAISLVIGLICLPFCNLQDGGSVYDLCIIPKTLAKIGDAVASVKAIADSKDTMFQIGTKQCDDLKKVKKEIKKSIASAQAEAAEDQEPEAPAVEQPGL